ncbi:MAG: hypothetical protein JOY90_16330 [Bradyrhizobium sp.]|uniref:hypothetical protein n=1 Tax=Bradyrhizobium sp. TaxID=376 RepID=UPI001DB31CD7|nr:hypothetical protein [Bradyrhizobium sp.]MBV9561990.1 hypothetical protein [Bradyrhizobium sp.]
MTVALLVASVIAGGTSSAVAADDPGARFRACSLVTPTSRSECPDEPPRVGAQPPKLVVAGDSWIVSETTSPVDYSPIATATTSSLIATDGSSMRLSIRCRGGHTELILTGAAITGRGDSYFISYRANDGRSVQLPGAAPAVGDGVAFKGDVAALLQSLPGEGRLVVRLLPLSGSELDGVFPLDGLDALRARIGPTCRWPHAIAKPNER